MANPEFIRQLAKQAAASKKANGYGAMRAVAKMMPSAAQTVARRFGQQAVPRAATPPKPAVPATSPQNPQNLVPMRDNLQDYRPTLNPMSVPRAHAQKFLDGVGMGQ